MSRSSQRIYCGSGTSNCSVVLTSNSDRTKICMGKSGRFVSQQRLNFLVLKITKLKGVRFVINSQYLDTILIHCVVRIQREKRRDFWCGATKISDLRIAISHLQGVLSELKVRTTERLIVGLNAGRANVPWGHTFDRHDRSPRGR
jgi:hypothetical protein